MEFHLKNYENLTRTENGSLDKAHLNSLKRDMSKKLKLENIHDDMRVEYRERYEAICKLLEG